MYFPKNYSFVLYQLYVTLNALQIYFQINRDHEFILTRYINFWSQEQTNYISELHSEIKTLNKDDVIVKNDFGWKPLIDDLVRFNHNHNRNITMYPLDIKKESDNVNSIFCSNSTSSPILCLENNGGAELHSAIHTLDWSHRLNDLIGLEKIVDQDAIPDTFMTDSSLNNSFYDLHLNTAANASLKFPKHISPIKKDAFLQNINSDLSDRTSFYNGSLRNIPKETKKQVPEMADVLYKQDVDLGYTLSPINSSSKLSTGVPVNKEEEAERVEAIQSLKDSKLAEILYQQDIDLGYILSSTIQNDSTILNDISSIKEDSKTLCEQKALKVDEIVKDLTDNANDAWAGIPFKIDNETGEYIRLPLDDLFQDILPLTEDISNTLRSEKLPEANVAEKSPSDLLDVPADDISLIMQSFWCSPPNQKHASENENSTCRQGICETTEAEEKSTNLTCHVRMDTRIQELTNLITPVPGFYGVNPDIPPYTHYHAHYPTKNSPNILAYASRQHSLHNPHREDSCFQTNFTHGMEPTGGLNTEYLNGEIHCIKNFTSNSTDLSQTEGFLSSFLTEECIQMMDISGNERSTVCNQGGILPIDNSNTVVAQSGEKSVDANNSSCANNVTERLDLSCDSAVSSLGSERVPSTSDGEWGEGSDSGQDYHQGNYYGPYDYSSNSRSFTARQMPVAQKKYHMFGKRYFQEQIPENSNIHSAIHFLHSNNSTSECEGIDNMIENTAFDECTDEMLPSADVKSTTKLIQSNVKSERDKFIGHTIRPQNLIRHNHTYTLLNNSIAMARLPRENSECKDILIDGHLTRDEKRARNLNVPIPVIDIINLPMDEFNERISKYDLTENQLSLIRDIRRRGKNKVAAQNCRKRKLDQILSLEGEVKEVRRRKEKLHSDRALIATEKKRIANKFAALHQHIFQFLRDAEGNLCSPSKYSLQQASDGSIYLLPRDSSKLDMNCHMSFLMGTNETNATGHCRQRRIQQPCLRTSLNVSPSTTSIQHINVEHKDN